MSSDIYNHLYKNGYPHGGLGFPIEWSGIDCSKLSVIDLGCGHGILCKRFKEYVGIDFSSVVIKEDTAKYPNVKFYVMDIIDVNNYISEYFDLVLAIDVLEHLPKDKIEDYLKAISEINGNEYLFSICCRESGFKDMNGNNLHLCVIDKNDWIKLLSKYFNVINTSDYNSQKTFCVKLRKL
jgi:cyclopropane fatty-acyl-phospholipid synthase-like methyltransferase